MSRTLDLLADVSIHGTVNGYRTGCTGAHCPSEVTCTEVYTRFAGDWGFRKAVNAGAPPVQLILTERADADAVRERDKAAARAEKKRDNTKAKELEDRKKGRSTLATSRGARRAATPKPKRARRATTGEIYGDRIRALHSEGLSDITIGRTLGIPVPTVQYTRSKVLNLPPNRQTRSGELLRDRAEQIKELHGQGLSDQQIADKVGASASTIWQTRERLSLPRNPAPRPKGTPSKHLPEVARLHAEGATDQEIANTLGVVKPHAAKLRRDLGLKVNRATRYVAPREPKPRVLQPHGTNACWARGCRRDECVEAHRQYHRDYVAARKREGAREYHGTAYGYQLGCRARSECPAETSCTDAMLAAERERRRTAGIPPKDLVDAAPVQAHIADLVRSGVTVQMIAERSGLSFAIIRKMVHSRGKGRGVVREVLAERAAAVLAVELGVAA